MDKPKVERLAISLEARGARVWFDKFRIKGSSSIPLEIEKGIEGSKTVIFCLSPAFLASEWTAYERASILASDPSNIRNSFILLKFEDCELPRGLRHFRYIDFRKFDLLKVDEVVEALGLVKADIPPIEDEVEALLAAAEHQEHGFNYMDAVRISREALDLALGRNHDEPARSRQIARCQSDLSHRILLARGDPREAWDLASLAAENVDLEGYPELRFSILSSKAEAAISTGQISFSQAAIDAAAALARDDRDGRTILQLRARLAQISGRTDEALDLYGRVVSSFLSLRDQVDDKLDKQRAWAGAAGAETNKGLVYAEMQDFRSSATAFSRAAKWYRLAGSPVDESMSLQLLAQSHFFEEEWDSGFFPLDRSIEIAKASGNRSVLLRGLLMRGRADASRGDLVAARDDLFAGLAEIPHEDAVEAFDFHEMLALLALKEGDDTEANRYAELARRFAERSNDHERIAGAARLGRRVIHRNSDSEAASDPQVRLLELELANTEEPIRCLEIMHRLATAYLSRKDWSNAQKWFRRSHRAATSISQKQGIAKASVGLAAVAAELHDDRRALTYLDEATELIDGSTDWVAMSSINFIRGGIEARQGELSNARRYLEDAYEVAASHGLRGFAAQIDQQLDSVHFLMELRKPAQMTFLDLASELEKLETWSLKDKVPLRRLWYYMRGEELIRNVLADSGAKALIVTDEAGNVGQWADALAVLFDVTTFIAPTRFSDSPRILEQFAIPADLPLQFVYIPTMRTL